MRSNGFGPSVDFRNSAQRVARNLCPLLRMISQRRQGPGERMDERPRWMPKSWTRAAELWYGKPHLQNPGALCKPLCSDSSMHLWVPAHYMESEWMQRCEMFFVFVCFCSVLFFGGGREILLTRILMWLHDTVWERQAPGEGPRAPFDPAESGALGSTEARGRRRTSARTRPAIPLPAHDSLQ